MNHIAQIVADGISQIRGLTEQDAMNIVQEVRETRRKEIKAAVLHRLADAYMYPVEVFEIRAVEGYHYGPRPPVGDLDYCGSMQYSLIHEPQDVRVQIGIDQPKERATAILRHILAEFEAMTDEEWAKYTASVPSEPKVGASDDIAF